MEIVEFVDPKSDVATSLTNELSNTLSKITGDDGRSSFSEDAFNVLTDAFLVLRINGEAIACGSLRKVDDNTCEIKRMYSRKRGYGKKVLEYLEAKAIELKYRYIILSTRKVNTQAVSFYHKNGYRDIVPYSKYKHTDLSVCMGKNFVA